MPEREIPWNEWQSFLEGYGQSHRGWLVTVEPEEGEADPLPLMGITAETGFDGKNAIRIRVGNALGDSILRIIRNPVRVVEQVNDSGDDEALEIESADGRKVSVRLRTAMPLEMVDGMPEM